MVFKEYLNIENWMLKCNVIEGGIYIVKVVLDEGYDNGGRYFIYLGLYIFNYELLL